MTSTTYRLGSAEMVYAPGIVAWAVNGGHFADDVPYLANVIASGWGIPEAAATALVTGEAAYNIDDETVVFTYWSM